MTLIQLTRRFAGVRTGETQTCPIAINPDHVIEARRGPSDKVTMLRVVGNDQWIVIEGEFPTILERLNEKGD